MKLARAILLVPVTFLLVAGARKPAVSVRFHAEANARDGEPFSMAVKFRNPERDGYVERVPSLSERDIKAIYPVPAGDGSFGCAFQFDQHGRIALQTLSTQRRGASLIVFVNTKSGIHQVIDMIIDRPITDGIVYVPRGLTELEIAALQKRFRTMGTSGKRK